MKNISCWMFGALLLAIPFSGLSAWAGGGAIVGNGGYGLLIHGKLYLLDLIEAGVEKKPFYDLTLTPDPTLLSYVQEGLPQFPEVHEKLARKLTELQRVSPIIAMILADTFRMYDFRVVNEALVDIHDLDDSVISYDPKSLVQLAIRRETSVFLNGKWWNRLGADQQAALLLHEIYYAFQTVEPVRKVTGHDLSGKPIFETVQGQRSGPARAFVGFLFTPGIKEQVISGIARHLRNGSRLFPLIKARGNVTRSGVYSWGGSYAFERPFLLRSTADDVSIEPDTPDLQLMKICYWAFRKNQSYSLYTSAVMTQNHHIREGIHAVLQAQTTSDSVTSCVRLLMDYRELVRSWR